MNWSSEFACSSRCRGTISGTIDMNAGPKNASPVPKTAARTIRCHSSTAPVSTRTPIVPTATARTRSAAIMIRRRSKRSEMTPPINTKMPIGSVHASPTSESAVGEFESS